MAATVSSADQRLSWQSGVEHKFKFLTIQERIGHDCVYNLTPRIGTGETAVVACSEEYWAVPYTGGGGPVFVSRLDAVGKTEPATSREQCVNGHKAECVCAAFSPHESWILTTVGDDGGVVVWNLAGVELNALHALEGSRVGSHAAGARDATFHPTAAGLLATSGGDGEVAVWDVERQAKAASMALPAAAGSLEFSYDGSLLSCCCRDRVLRCVDPRQPAGASTMECEPHGVPRAFHATWLGSSGCLVSCGAAKRGGREVALLDSRKLDQPMGRKILDSSTGALLPTYSEETRVLWLWGRGDTTVRHFEVRPDKAEAFSQGLEWRTSSGPHCGVAALPTRCLDVAGLEIGRFLRLSNTTLETVSYAVPRTPELKKFFNDDVYPVAGVRDRRPTIGAEAWLAGDDAPPLLLDIRPPDAPLLSERKVEAKVLHTTVVNKRLEEEKNQKEEDAQTYARLQKLATQFEQFQPNNSMGARPGVDAARVDGDEVADDEWDD